MHREEVIHADLKIIDTHHHLWDGPAHRIATHYPLERLLQDIGRGHRITQTVYVECGSHYRTSGPDDLRPVGETEWVSSLPAPGGILAGIVGFADVRRGAGVQRILDAHLEAAGERFKGVRYSAAYDEDPEVLSTARDAPPGTLLESQFQLGVRTLGDRGLLFETWVYFHQLGEVLSLARSAPQTTIVLDHLGGLAGPGIYAGRRNEVRAIWRENMSRLAGQDNIVVKIGGIGFPSFVEPDAYGRFTSSEKIAKYWLPEFQFCIDTFGPRRCMLESNFPVDSSLCEYATIWNSFKRMAEDLGEADKNALFSETARRIYNLP